MTPGMEVARRLVDLLTAHAVYHRHFEGTYPPADDSDLELDALMYRDGDVQRCDRARLEIAITNLGKALDRLRKEGAA